MPFPCGEPTCSNFHENLHGFCDKHRFNHVWWKASSACSKACSWLELIILLTIQAAAEIQSRVLLLLILLSLLPVTCVFLEQSTGMSAASICMAFLVVVVGSCFLTARRLDAMQQTTFRLALATEANYFQVLQPAGSSEHLVQVSTILTDHGSTSEVRQDLGLKSSYHQAKCHMSLFRSTVCDPLSEIGEVVAKIKPVTELETEVDILCCEVFCESLQEVEHAWEVLKAKVEIVAAEDCFATASSRKCCRVVVSVQGYKATVFLLEKSLSLDAPKGISYAANSLGLWDTKATSWQVSGPQRVSEVPRCVSVATAFLRIVAFCSSVGVAVVIHMLIIASLGSYESSLLSRLTRTLPLSLPMSLPFWTCAVILLWELRCCCCCICRRQKSFRIRLRPTQVWYRRYLGVQGSHYALKVAVLQLLTVAIQGFAKASVLRTIRDSYGSEALKSSTAVQCFLSILVCNAILPAGIVAIPNWVSSRVLAAVMDALFDLGYLITSLWLYAGFVESAVNLENIFLGPGSFFNYAALYICVAHVLCVCRSLDTADWAALFQVPRAAPMWGVWKRIVFSTAYAFALVGFVAAVPGGIFLGDSSSSPKGPCAPCKCSTVAPNSLLLERCFIPTGYIVQQASPLQINLTKCNITEVLPDAFLARGVHQRVSSLSLRGNDLTELPGNLFMDLLEQEDGSTRLQSYDVSGFEVGLWMDRMDLAENRLTELPPNIFQKRSWQASRLQGVTIEELHLEGNLLTTLPPGVFHGVRVNQLHLQDNRLTQLHAESFKGLRCTSNHCNRLPLPIINLTGNQLSNLPAGIFAGLKLRALHLEGNHLTTVAPGAFQDLEVNRLHLQENGLSEIHAESFRGLRFEVDFVNGSLVDSMLDISRNKLQALPAFPTGYPAYTRSYTLNLEENRLTTIPPGAFQGVSLRQLNLKGNNLTELHRLSFKGLDCPVMNLADNWLSSLPGWVFHVTSSELRELNLKRNNFTDLVLTEGFRGAPQYYLRRLNLEQNQLIDLYGAFMYLEQLEELKLGGNRLGGNRYGIPEHLFEDLWKLRHLELQSNQLVTLPLKLFQSLGSTSAFPECPNMKKQTVSKKR